MVLVGYWPLDGDALDHAGSNSGTVNGATSGATGLLGRSAYSFDGSDDYIQTPAFNISADQPISITAWVNPSAIGSNDTVVRQWVSGGSPNVLILRVQSGAAYWWLWDGGSSQEIFSTTTLSTGTWYHLAGTYDGATSRLYVNGVEEASTAFAGRNTGSAQVEFGRRENNSEFFSGRISEIRAYNHALSPQEVLALYSVVERGRLVTNKETL